MPTLRVTHVSEQVLPIFPVYTPGGRGSLWDISSDSDLINHFSSYIVTPFQVEGGGFFLNYRIR